jgi:hypothetical protein
MAAAGRPVPGHQLLIGIAGIPDHIFRANGYDHFNT